MKIGQSLSTRPDLVAPEYIKALSAMQDHCVLIDFSEVKETIETELQVRLSKAFSSFDEKPLAAASLGQVHRASLRDGKQVVVKVQRPGAESRVHEDLTVLAQLAEKIEQHSETGRHFGFSQWVVELRRSLTRELDYLTEAGNLETLSTTLAPDLNFAAVIKEYLAKVIRHRAFDQLKPSASIPNILETTEMLQAMPRQVSTILTMLAENR